MKITDASKKILPWYWLYGVLLIDLILFTAWFWVLKDDQTEQYKWIGLLPSVLSNFVTITASIYAIVAGYRGAFSRGGTQFYKKKYGERRLKKILNKEREVFDAYDVYYITSQLLKEKSTIADSKFFEISNYILTYDLEYTKIWNDHNYMSGIIHPSDKDIIYMKNLESYVRYSIYRIYNKLIQESIKNDLPL